MTAFQMSPDQYEQACIPGTVKTLKIADGLWIEWDEQGRWTMKLCLHMAPWSIGPIWVNQKDFDSIVLNMKPRPREWLKYCSWHEDFVGMTE